MNTLAALKNSSKRAILTSDTLSENGTFQRTGSIAVWAIDDIAVTANGLSLNSRTASLTWSKAIS